MLRPKPTNNVKDNEIREVLDYLLQEAKGDDLELSDTPTASSPLLQDNQNGVKDNVLYKRKGSKIYVFTPSSTIDIT